MRKKPRFKRDDRVEWLHWPGRTPAVRLTGTIRDTHKLGGWGYAYEVQPDGQHRSRTTEVSEGELEPLGILDRIVDAVG